METAKFVDLVENMRQAQKNYFKTRDKKQMTRAIILEELVDKEIEVFKQTMPPRTPTTAPVGGFHPPVSPPPYVLSE